MRPEYLIDTEDDFLTNYVWSNVIEENELFKLLASESIEDDLPTIRLIKSFFESRGVVCKGAISGRSGYEELHNSKPKLILLDIILPDVSGYDLCKRIKEEEEYKDIPLYFLTAIPESEVEKKLEETGADGYILKPFDFSDFEIVFKNLQIS